jgi:hypothetical protein
MNFFRRMAIPLGHPRTIAESAVADAAIVKELIPEKNDRQCDFLCFSPGDNESEMRSLINRRTFPSSYPNTSMRQQTLGDSLDVIP